MKSAHFWIIRNMEYFYGIKKKLDNQKLILKKLGECSSSMAHTGELLS